MRHDLHEVVTDDLHSTVTEDVVPRDTADLPPCSIRHSQAVHNELERLLEVGVEFWSPSGERLTTIDEIAATFEKHGRVLGPRQRRLGPPEPTDGDPLSLPGVESEET